MTKRKRSDNNNVPLPFAQAFAPAAAPVPPVPVFVVPGPRQAEADGRRARTLSEEGQTPFVRLTVGLPHGPQQNNQDAPSSALATLLDLT